MRTALLLVASCSLDPTSVELPPRGNETRSVVAIVEGVTTRVRAIDTAGGGPRFLFLYPDEKADTITILHYEGGLIDLGLPPGDLPIAAEDSCARARIPIADRAFRGPAKDPLTEVGSSSIDPVDVELPCPCVDFVFERIELAFEPVRALVPYDHRTLVISDAETNLIDERGALFRVNVPAPFFSGAKDSTGRFWFGDGTGGLWSGDPLSELVRAPQSPATDYLGWIDVSKDTSTLEVLVISRDRLFLRFDGSTWETLYSAVRTSDDQEGALRFVGPDHALGLLPNDNGILEYRRSESIDAEDWNPLDRGHLVSLEIMQPFGLLIGTRTGRTFLRTETAIDLTELTDIAIEARGSIEAFVPFRGGFLEVGDHGLVRQWHPTSGYCEAHILDFLIELELLAPVGDLFFAAGERNVELGAEVNAAYLITPLP